MTSKRTPGSAAAPQDSSPPTAPGSPAACSRTTSPAGPPASGAPTPRANSPSRPPSATGSSPCRAASSTTAADTDCACRSTGPGRTPSPPPCNESATCPCSSEPPTAPGAAQTHPTRHQPAPAPHPNPARPKTRRPAHTHQPRRPPGPNRRSHKPVGGFRLNRSDPRSPRPGAVDAAACDAVSAVTGPVPARRESHTYDVAVELQSAGAASSAPWAHRHSVALRRTIAGRVLDAARTLGLGDNATVTAAVMSTPSGLRSSWTGGQVDHRLGICGVTQGSCT